MSDLLNNLPSDYSKFPDGPVEDLTKIIDEDIINKILNKHDWEDDGSMLDASTCKICHKTFYWRDHNFSDYGCKGKPEYDLGASRIIDLPKSKIGTPLGWLDQAETAEVFKQKFLGTKLEDWCECGHHLSAHQGHGHPVGTEPPIHCACCGCKGFINNETKI